MAFQGRDSGRAGLARSYSRQSGAIFIDYQGTATSGTYAGDLINLVFSYSLPVNASTDMFSFSPDSTSRFLTLDDDSGLDPVSAALYVGGQVFSIGSSLGPPFDARTGSISKDVSGGNLQVASLDIGTGGFATAGVTGRQTGALADLNLTSSFSLTPNSLSEADSSASATFDHGTQSVAFSPSLVFGGAGSGAIVTPTPELPAWASLLMGLAAFGGFAWWRKTKDGSEDRRVPIPA